MSDPNVCVVMLPRAPKVPYKFLSDLLEIFYPITSRVYVITGNSDRIKSSNKEAIIKDIGLSMHNLTDIKPMWFSQLLTLFKIIGFQFKVSYELLKLRKEIDVIIFYVTWPYYLLPVLVSKIIRTPTLEILTRSEPRSKSLLNRLYILQDKLLLSLIDYISPESPSLVSNLGINDHKKVLPMGARYIDMNYFKVKKRLGERENIVGYIGRLDKSKGVLNLIKVIPLIKKECSDIKFLIGGDGELLDDVKRIKEKEGYEIRVPGWIPEDEFVDYLNELKLLVLPTQHYEGLPTIILEAMACGTPVLATPLGAIQDVVKDGETGFIMEDNSPECIAENILRVLSHHELETVVINARELLKEDFSYEAAVGRYEQIIKKATNVDD